MSRKDYEAIGSVLAGEWAITRGNSRPDSALTVWSVTLSIADKFKQDNPRFDRKKFYKYVFGVEDHFEARDSLYAVKYNGEA